MGKRGPAANSIKKKQTLLDAAKYGEAEAARRNGVSDRTVRKWKREAREDTDLQDEIGIDVESEDDFLSRFIEKAVDRAKELLETTEDLDSVTRAIERIGNLDITRYVLRGGQPSDMAGDSEDEADPRQESLDF